VNLPLIVALKSLNSFRFRRLNNVNIYLKNDSGNGWTFNEDGIVNGIGHLLEDLVATAVSFNLK
jgi:ABC-type uncharacterized transport system permease subunit